jgi:uncharacterized membrane protein YraQ (UPF0718 family)
VERRNRNAEALLSFFNLIVDSEERACPPRISSPEAITATSHYFVMDWAMVWKDIAGGLLIAGAVSAWVPQNFWKTLFFTSHPVAAIVWGPIIALTVCSAKHSHR